MTTTQITTHRHCYMIGVLRESGLIKENEPLEKEDNDLVNIVGNVVGKVEVVERENKKRSL